MKTQATILLIATCIIMAACQSLPKAQIVNRPGCITLGGMNPVRIVITANQNDFGVRPPNLCIEPGDTVTVRVTGNRPEGSVRVIGKSGATWINGTNSPDNMEFTFDVPSELPIDTYFYTVVVDDYGVIDPMLTIDR